MILLDTVALRCQGLYTKLHFKTLLKINYLGPAPTAYRTTGRMMKLAFVYCMCHWRVWLIWKFSYSSSACLYTLSTKVFPGWQRLRKVYPWIQYTPGGAMRNNFWANNCCFPYLTWLPVSKSLSLHVLCCFAVSKNLYPWIHIMLKHPLLRCLVNSSRICQPK